MKALFIVGRAERLLPWWSSPCAGGRPGGARYQPADGPLPPSCSPPKDWHPSEDGALPENGLPHCVPGGRRGQSSIRRSVPTGLTRSSSRGTGNRDDGLLPPSKPPTRNLAEYLRRHGVEELYVTGVGRPTTASRAHRFWDALREGFRTYVVHRCRPARSNVLARGWRAGTRGDAPALGAILVTSEELLSAQEAPAGARQRECYSGGSRISYAAPGAGAG
jgi:nicotinamidase-related amidase